MVEGKKEEGNDTIWVAKVGEAESDGEVKAGGYIYEKTKEWVRFCLLACIFGGRGKLEESKTLFKYDGIAKHEPESKATSI